MDTRCGDVDRGSCGEGYRLVDPTEAGGIARVAAPVVNLIANSLGSRALADVIDIDVDGVIRTVVDRRGASDPDVVRTGRSEVHGVIHRTCARNGCGGVGRFFGWFRRDG